jgi:hypothetical protein
MLEHLSLDQHPAPGGFIEHLVLNKGRADRMPFYPLRGAANAVCCYRPIIILRRHSGTAPVKYGVTDKKNVLPQNPGGAMFF